MQDVGLRDVQVREATGLQTWRTILHSGSPYPRIQPCGDLSTQGIHAGSASWRGPSYNNLGYVPYIHVASWLYQGPTPDHQVGVVIDHNDVAP